MRQRCNDRGNKRYNRYGGRGIKVCAAWNHRNSFPAFFAHVGLAPSARHTLGRIDNDGDYKPGNVEWQTQRRQANSKSSNRVIAAFDKRQTLSEWAAELGVKRESIATRLKSGWTAKRALSEPIAEHKPYSTTPITLDGESHSLAEWSRITGIKVTTLFHRLHRSGWTIRQALTSKDASPRRDIKAFGKTRTLTEWARETGISVGTIQFRLDKLKWSAERSLRTPPLRIRSGRVVGTKGRLKPSFLIPGTRHLR